MPVNHEWETMSIPKVSVIIPTFNRKEKLEHVLRSLSDQTYPAHKLEIIVVDDGSTDKTADLLEQMQKKIHNLKYFTQERKGAASARNFGIRASEGEIIMFTDDDCIVPKDWIRKIVLTYQRYPEVAGVGGYMEAEKSVLKTNIFARYESYMSKAVYHAGEKEYVGGFECPAGGTNNMSYKKRVLEEVGFFDDTFPSATAEDADLKLRVCLKGYKLAYVPLKVVHVHEYNVGAFTRQQIRRGVGEACFLKKWRGVLNEGEKKRYHATLDVSLLARTLSNLKFEVFCLLILSTFVKRWGKWGKK